MENKKNNKKFFIIGGIVVVVVIIALVVMMNMQKQQEDSIEVSNNDIVNNETYTYGNTQVNNMNKGILVEDDGYIYYSVRDKRDSYYVFKKSKQNDEVTELTSAQARYLNIYKDEIYYINEDEHSIFKMKKDGSNRERVLDRAKSMCILNDYLFYIEGDSFYNELYKLDLNNRKTKKLTNEDVKEFTIYKDTIYYISNTNQQLYKINLLGKEKQEIFTDKVENICIVNDMIYVSDITDGKAIYQISLDGKENKKILSMDNSLMNSYIIINNQIGVLEKKILTNHLCLYDMNGNAINQISLKELYENLGLYFPNTTCFGVYDKTVLVDSSYNRYEFKTIE